MGSPTQTSKMLDPMEEETAMSPSPLRATMTEVMRSGMDVPAARIVRPMISMGIPIVFPISSAHQTMSQEKKAIQRMAPTKVMGNQRRLLGLRTSGSVSQSGKTMGARRM